MRTTMWVGSDTEPPGDSINRAGGWGGQEWSVVGAARKGRPRAPESARRCPGGLACGCRSCRRRPTVTDDGGCAVFGVEQIAVRQRRRTAIPVPAESSWHINLDKTKLRSLARPLPPAADADAPVLPAIVLALGWHQLPRADRPHTSRLRSELGDVSAGACWTWESRAAVACGSPEEGFLWLACDPEVCTGWWRSPAKGAACPRCGGRRMAQGAARLVDDVLPVRARQAVGPVDADERQARADMEAGARRACPHHRRATDTGILPPHHWGTSGLVTVIQRFGSSLNLNIHFHILALDGGYLDEGDGRARFVTSRPPRTTELRNRSAHPPCQGERWPIRVSEPAERSAHAPSSSSTAGASPRCSPVRSPGWPVGQPGRR